MNVLHSPTTLTTKSCSASPVRAASRVYHSVLIAVCIIALSSCSYLKPKTGENLQKYTVARVSSTYLGWVFAGSEDHMGNYVVWSLLLSGSDGKPMSREDFRKQLKSIQNRWTTEEHPIFDLDLKSVEVDGNQAEVRFQRLNRSHYPVITLELRWSGTGWLIERDSLFGQGGQVEKWMADPGLFKETK